MVLDDSQEDNTGSIQKEIDAAAAAGKTTVDFKQGERKYRISAPVRIHGSINRLIGMESVVDVSDPDGVFDKGQAVFTLEDIKSPVFVAERFFGLGGWKWQGGGGFFGNPPFLARSPLFDSGSPLFPWEVLKSCGSGFSFRFEELEVTELIVPESRVEGDEG